MTDLDKPATWFWVVSVIALLWNLLGLFAYVMQAMITPEMLAALPQAEQDLYNSAPTWSNIAFAIAVIAGTLGCIALLTRKAWAIPLFVLSLIGVVGQQIYGFFLSNAIEVYGTQAIVMPIVVLAVAIFLVWFSRTSKAKGWIG